MTGENLLIVAKKTRNNTHTHCKTFMLEATGIAYPRRALRVETEPVEIENKMQMTKIKSIAGRTGQV